MILAIDPGTTESGWVIFDGERVIDCGVNLNESLIDLLRIVPPFYTVAIEKIASYGMAVGAEVFDTCIWIGRFSQLVIDAQVPLKYVYRKDVKLHLCGSPRAKDANIRQALIDKFGSVGTKKNPGPLFGVKSHIWSALAVAVTALETGAK